MDFLLLFVVLCAFVAGILAYKVFLELSERKALSIVRTQANAKGRQVQVEQDSQLMSFLLEVKESFEKSKLSMFDVWNTYGMEWKTFSF